MGMEVYYKHISPWLLGLLAKQPELVEPFMLCLPDAVEPNRLE